MTASANEIASRAGLEILHEVGNAVDAEPAALIFDIAQKLHAMGHTINPRLRSQGHVHAVVVKEGTGWRLGLSDGRRGGRAVGYQSAVNQKLSGEVVFAIARNLSSRSKSGSRVLLRVYHRNVRRGSGMVLDAITIFARCGAADIRSARDSARVQWAVGRQSGGVLGR